jgi:predicted ATPase
MTATQNLEEMRTNEAHTAPPFLSRVCIRGYKSIACCDVTLEPLTILVGRNASGKSNFLDALGFLHDVMNQNVSEAVASRNGWRSVHCRNSSSPYLEMELAATCPSYNSVWDAEYSFSLEAERHLVHVRQETLVLKEQEGNRQCGFSFEGGKFRWIGKEHFANGSIAALTESIPWMPQEDKLSTPHFFTGPQHGGRLVLSMIATQPFLDLRFGLQASAVYNFSPPAIREHQPNSGWPFLASDGRNLARAIAALKEVEPETLARIAAYLQAMVPEVSGFERIEYGDFETVQFSIKDAAGDSTRRFDASSMSDGTLRILAALMAAFQIVELPDGYPGFIAIEEPETSLHPAAMRALVDALNEATARTQILLTTHSADLLDNPTIHPKNIRVVEMIDGQTVIGPVDEASVEIVRRNLDTLGGLERQNQLTIDPDELARQRRLAETGPEQTP